MCAQTARLEPALLTHKVAAFVSLISDTVFANLLQQSYHDATSKWKLAESLLLFLRLVLCECTIQYER